MTAVRDLLGLLLAALLAVTAASAAAQPADSECATTTTTTSMCTETASTPAAFDELESIKAKFADTARRVRAANAKLADASDAYDRPPIELDLVDIGPFTYPSKFTDAERAAAVAALVSAFRKVGFALIAGHGVPDPLADELVAQELRFFRNPDEYKRVVEKPQNSTVQRGWTRFKPGIAEVYGVVPDGEAERERFGANIFPDDMPDLGRAATWYYRDVERVYATVLRMVSLGLGLAPDHLHRAQGAHRGLMLLNYAPGLGVHERKSVDAHTDWGMLTVLRLVQHGLELVTMDDEWRSVPPLNSTFVVNVGDALERITNGELLSTIHTVRRWRDVERVSIPFFGGQALAAGDETLIRPLDALSGGAARFKYPPFKYNEFIANHWRAFREHGLPKVGETQRGASQAADETKR